MQQILYPVRQLMILSHFVNEIQQRSLTLLTMFAISSRFVNFHQRWFSIGQSADQSETKFDKSIVVYWRNLLFLRSSILPNAILYRNWTCLEKSRNTNVKIFTIYWNCNIIVSIVFADHDQWLESKEKSYTIRRNFCE